MTYFIVRAGLSIVLPLVTGEVKGFDNIPRKGGCILAPNHSSYLDHILLGYNLYQYTGRVMHPLAKKEHWNGFFQRTWHKYVRTIPIDREAGGKEALATAVKHLKKGDIILIYPEGTRTLTGKLNRAKTGVARLALASKVPVVPVGMTNTFEILPKGKRIPKLGKKADLYIGKPLTFESYYGKENDRKALREITTLVMREIGKLCKKSYDFDEEKKQRK